MLSEQRQKEHHFDTQREKLLHDKKELVEHLNREYNDKNRMIEKRNQVGSSTCEKGSVAY